MLYLTFNVPPAVDDEELVALRDYVDSVAPRKPEVVDVVRLEINGKQAPLMSKIRPEDDIQYWKRRWYCTNFDDMSSPASSTQQLKLPAFGRELLQVREADQVPVRSFANAHVIVALDTWGIGRNHWRLVIDQNDDPLALDFVGIAGLDVLLAVNSFVTDLRRRNAAARAILRSRPTSLIELDVRAPHRVRIIKSRQLGVELKEFM